MTENTSVRIVEYLRIIALLLLIGLAAIYSVTYILTGTVSDVYFLLAASTLVGIALLNLLFSHLRRDDNWFPYTLFMFAGLFFIFVGNLVMAGIFYITPDGYFNSVFFVGTGLVIYILGLRTKSPLLLRSSEEESAKPRYLVRNLFLLIVCVTAVVGLFYFTAFNPYGDTLSVAVLLCNMILASALAFALGKSFEAFPMLFKVVLVIGFLSLMYSSWVLAVIEITSSDFLSMFVVGISFMGGQFLIHLSPIVGTKPES